MPWDQVVSFLAGVTAVVVGQLVAHRFQREADERRWDRQEVDRRRARAEEAADTIMDEVVKVARRCDDLAREDFLRQDAYPLQSTIRPAYDAINRAATRVPDDAVRLAAERAASLLFFSSPSEMHVPTHRLVGAVERDMRAIVSAYLTGRPIPPTPGMDAMYVKLEEFQSWIAEQIAEGEEEGESEVTVSGGSPPRG